MSDFHALQGFTTVLSDMCPATSGHGFSDVRQSLELGERAAQLALGRANFSLGLSTDPDDESERPKMGLSALDGEPGRRRQGLRPLDDEIGRAKVGWIVPQVLRYLDDETGRPVVRYSSVEGEIVMKDGFVHLTRGTSGRTDVDTLNNEASLAAKLADECEELMEAESAAGKDGGRPKEGANAAGDESGRPKEGGNLAGDESGRPKVGANAAADESVQSKVGASSAGGGPGHPNLERDADQGLLLPGGSFVVKLLEGEGTKGASVTGPRSDVRFFRESGISRSFQGDNLTYWQGPLQSASDIRKNIRNYRQE